jgi:succinoglycan biosynthesis protein ExoV
MKLYYFNHSADPNVSVDYRNFGDDLNPWIWTSLLPGAFDNCDDPMFLGVGSHLNAAFAKRFQGHRKIVFGTGYGSGEQIGRLDDSWNVYCVRGPITAQSLGISGAVAVGDAALLVRRLMDCRPTGGQLVSYMPHCGSAGAAWRSICESLDMQYIDPRWPSEDVFNAMRRSRLLVSEALHGAIVADALRIPWVPVLTTKQISVLKWQDWCASIDVQYKPLRMLPLWDIAKSAGKSVRLRLAAKMKWNLLRLRQATRVTPLLSSDSRIESMDEELGRKLENIREDIARGKFARLAAAPGR